MCIVHGSGRVQAPNCGVLASRSDFAAGLIHLSLPDKTFVVKPTGWAPVVYATNINTWGWDGTFTSTRESNAAGDPREVTSATVKFRRAQDVYPSLFPPAATPIGTFVVESGNFTWSISGQHNGCTTEGHDAWCWNGGPFDEAPSGGLSVFPEVLRGGVYRKYGGSGSAGGHKSTITVTCPAETPSVTISSVSPTWWKSGAGGATSNISIDGALLSGSAIVDGTLYEWTLKAAREP